MPVRVEPDLSAVDRVDDLPAAAWDELAGPDDLYLGCDWMRVLESTSGAPMRYLLASDGGALTGGLPTVLADDTAPWRSGRPDALLERCVGEERPGAAALAAHLPNDLTAALLPGLVCGGRHLGRNRLLTAGPDGERVAGRLVASAESSARERGCRSVSYLYVDERDHLLRRVLERRGYHRWESARYHVLAVPDGGFAGYVAALSSHRRRRIEADRRKLRDAGVAIGIEPLTAAVIDRMAELETELLERYGLTWSADLSARIFATIHAAVGGAAQISTARIDGRLTGFVLLVPRGRCWYAHRAGFDYAANGSLPVYFDVTYNAPLELAPERGVTAIHYGTGSDATKVSRGCTATAQHAYLLALDRESPVHRPPGLDDHRSGDHRSTDHRPGDFRSDDRGNDHDGP